MLVFLILILNLILFKTYNNLLMTVKIILSRFKKIKHKLKKILKLMKLKKLKKHLNFLKSNKKFRYKKIIKIWK